MKFSFSKIPLWIKIIIFFLTILLLIVGPIATILMIEDYEHSKAEKIINQKFKQEAASVPQLNIKKFSLYLGHGYVTAQVENKGEVTFTYHQDGIPQFMMINNQQTSYDCFFVDQAGKKISYAYRRDLILDNKKLFAKWFPLQVNNLQDIVNHYDEILKILDTFPKNPKTVYFKVSFGEIQVLESSNPDFVIKEKYRNKEVWCDLYQKTN